LRLVSEVSSDPESARWRTGSKEFPISRAEKLESAAKNLDTASRQLARLGREHESGQPLVARLIALAMLGRYQSAQTTGEKALQIFTKHRDQLAAGKIEMNLSNIVSRRDQYRLAEKYCLSAYRRFTKLGERTWQTMAENGLANTYAELNDFERAEEFYERALASARRARMSVTVAEIEASMGNLAFFRGRYADAIRLLESSRIRYEKLGMPHQSAIADLEIADIYSELNLNAEASDIYRRLIPTLRRLRMRAEEARARANFGRTFIALGSFADARRELKSAAKLYRREHNRTASAAVMLRLASVELKNGNYNGASKLADESYTELRNGDNARLELAALWLRGEALSKAGRFLDAGQLLNDALRRAAKLEQPTIARAAMNSLGLIARKQGEGKRAEKMFEAAIESAESARAPLPGEEYQMAFLAKSLEPFENLTRLHLAAGEMEKAFIVTERARSRSLLDAIASPDRKRA
jgi:tetratricopeptide (TPR) repeat protein